MEENRNQDETEPRVEVVDEAEPGKLNEETAEQEADAISDQITALQRERDHFSDQLLRLRAEFDNYRKRMSRESERIRKTAAESLLRDLLPVVDHLELAVRHGDGDAQGIAEGVAMVLRQMHDVLARFGLEPIASEGQAFDPAVHEAVMQQASPEVPAGSVVTEFQKGYRLSGVVLRPAKVIVSSGPESAAEATEKQTGSGEKSPVE